MILLEGAQSKEAIQDNKFGLVGEFIENSGNWVKGILGMDAKPKQYSTPVKFNSLTELFSKGSWKHDFGEKVRDESAVRLGAFYDQWSNYLSSIPQVMTYLVYIPQFFARSLYGISMGLEEAYSALFGLFGFFNYLGDGNSYLGQIFNGLRLLGISLFVLLLVVKVTASFFSKPLPYGEVLNSLLLATMISSFLPQALETAGYFSKDIATKTLGMSDGKTSTEKKGSLSIVPVKNNVVDVKQLIRADFNADSLKMDQQGYVSFNSDFSTKSGLNKITDSTFMHTDLTAWYGAPDKDVLEWFKKNKDNGYNEGVITLFTHKLGTNDDDQVEIKTIKDSEWFSKTNVFLPVYLRYRVNWIGLFVQQILIIAVLFSMGIKLVQSIFSILVGSAIAPFVVYTSVGNTAKIKDVIQTLIAAFVGINVEIIIVRFALIFMRDGVGMVSSNLGFWPSILVSIMIYFGAYTGIMNGSQMVERWLGVSTAQTGGRQFMGSLARTAATAYVGSRIAKGSLNAVSGAAKGVQKGFGSAKGFKDATEANGGGIKGAAKTASNLTRQPEYDARQKTALDGQNLDKHGNQKSLGGGQFDENGYKVPGTGNTLTGNEGKGVVGAVESATTVGAMAAGVRKADRVANGVTGKVGGVVTKPFRKGTSNNSTSTEGATSQSRPTNYSSKPSGTSDLPPSSTGGLSTPSTSAPSEEFVETVQASSGGIETSYQAPSGVPSSSRGASQLASRRTTSQSQTTQRPTRATNSPKRELSRSNAKHMKVKQSGSQLRSGVGQSQVKDKLQKLGKHEAKGSFSLDDF